jgi:hypothetical protein
VEGTAQPRASVAADPNPLKAVARPFGHPGLPRGFGVSRRSGEPFRVRGSPLAVPAPRPGDTRQPVGDVVRLSRRTRERLRPQPWPFPKPARRRVSATLPSANPPGGADSLDGARRRGELLSGRLALVGDLPVLGNRPLASVGGLLLAVRVHVSSMPTEPGVDADPDGMDPATHRTDCRRSPWHRRPVGTERPCD